MPEDALDQVLRLVAEGRLTAAEAEPVLAALDGYPDPAGARRRMAGGGGRGRVGDPGREIRIEVREDKRIVVNLRLPIAIGRYALDRVPGLTDAQVRRVREALESGVTGPVLAVDDEHGSVRIVIE